MSRSAPLLGALLAALLNSACSPPPTCSPGVGGGTGTGGGAGPGGVAIGRTGTLSAVSLTGDLQQCTATPSNAGVTVETRVRRADGTDLPHPRAALTLDGLFPEARVSFTPDQPGLYEVIARFEPNRGTAQVTTHAAQDLTQRAGRKLGVPAGAGCRELEELSSGAVLCLDSAQQLKLFRDGVLKAQVPAFAFASRANVVWVVEAGRVDRYEAGNDQLAAPLRWQPSSLPGVPVLIPLSDDELMLGLDALYWRVRKTGSTLTGEPFDSGLSGSPASWALMDGRWLAADAAKACRGTLGVSGAPQCVELLDLGQPVGRDAHGIWYTRLGALRVVPAQGAGVPEQRITDFPPELAADVRPGQGAPVLTRSPGATQFWLARPTPNGIVLEDWGPGGKVVTATATKRYVERADGYEVFERP